MAKPVYTKETIQREAVALVANYGTARNAAAAIYQQTRGLKGGPVARHTVEMWISDVMTGVDVDAPTAERPRIYTKGTLTRALAESLVREHGTAAAAAAAIAQFTRNRLGKGNVDPTTIKSWFSDVLADSESARNTADRRAEKAAGHPILENAYSNEDLNRLATLLKDANIPVDAIAKIDGVNVKSWGVHAKVKDADGNQRIETKSLYASTLKFTPRGPAFPVITPAAPTKVVFTAVPRIMRKTSVAVVLSDAQIGFLRDFHSDVLEPIHDPDALDVAFQIVGHVAPNQLGVIGDWLDLAQFSRWDQHPEYDRTTQPAIDAGHRILAEFIAAAGPQCKDRWCTGGNHDARFERYLLKHAKAALYLRPADSQPEDWPSFSMPSMLRFKELGVSYSGQYPSGEHWLSDTLVAMHAPPKKLEMRASVIHGHTHHIGTSTSVTHGRGGRATHMIYDIGCLCRVGSTDVPYRLLRTQTPSDRARTDWAQGIAIVEMVDGGHHQVTQVRIENGTALYAGRAFQARRIAA
jgi:hypothetical protein